MVDSMIGRFRGTAVIVAGALLTTVFIACATATHTTSGAQRERIADVRVERDGDATVVTLVGLDDPVFTAFQQVDPERIILDLSAVDADVPSGPLAVYDGLVEEISMSPFPGGGDEGMTRVEISVARAVVFETNPSEAGLSIRLEPASGLFEASAEAGMDEVDDAADDPWAVASMPSGAEAEMAVAPEPVATTPATTLRAIEARELEGGTLIGLRADGEIASAASFTLENPDRLVIDLPGMVSQLESGRIEVGSGRVETIRVGQHEDMVRVVVDAGSTAQPFEGRRVVPDQAGLWVALGSGEALEVALEEASSASVLAMAASDGDAVEDMEPEIAPMAMEPETEVTAMDAASAPAAMEVADDDVTATPPVTIYGVEFDVQEGHDRIVVLGDRPADYLVYEPDPETLVLSIARAEIEPEAAVRIAPEEGGPVSLVTAFAQPDVKTSEVRVVVKRASDLKPEISRRGSLLVLDFARSGGIAARPPVMETGAGEMAPTAEGSTAVVADASDSEAAAPAAIAPEGENVDLSGDAAPASLEPPASIEILQEGGLIDGKEYSGRRISLDFKDVDIADVLRLIAEVSDLNVIAGDEVAGQVTIRLVDVPWDQALDIILLTKGLGFMRIGNVLRIAPNNVIAQEEEARLQERRAKERLEDLVVKLQPVNYATAQDVAGMVKQLLTERGTVNVDTRTNTLILKDIASVIDEATALIKAIDTQTPQVMIEAKIVEAKLQFSREFGTVWAIGVQPYNDAFDDGSGLRRDIGGNLARFRPSQINEATNGAVFANPITAGPTALANLGAFLLDENINLDLQLQAAEVNGDGKVISSPRVVTMDNSKAKIEQGVSIPFQTFENGDAQLEFVDAVLKLDVTPHITANKAIIMKVKVTRNAPDDSVFTLTGSPAIAKNEVDTETLVKDGQTLVLGGIYTIGKSQRQSRVPYLHSIPILGGLFRNNEISDDRQELLIFVTPRVVQADMSAT